MKKEVSKKAGQVVDNSNRLKELVKPTASESLLQEAEFLCGEHNAACRRNNSIIDEDDILF
ncbi:FlmA family RiPP peptide [Maribacter flavus]|uniref:Uncharacterized protein n=1 Tax=Maribacter flavus TaxID=1658664 RepID=A0A5B2TMR4_9FLAO|nr:hypothetical protein [Maribacter flavus]KAA2215792.1 hypothetical protein F0361_16485 [Maribacter flavus]